MQNLWQSIAFWKQIQRYRKDPTTFQTKQRQSSKFPKVQNSSFRSPISDCLSEQKKRSKSPSTTKNHKWKQGEQKTINKNKNEQDRHIMIYSVFVSFERDVILYELHCALLSPHFGSGHDNIIIQGTYKEGSFFFSVRCFSHSCSIVRRYFNKDMSGL